MRTTLPCKCHVHTEVLKSADLFQSVFPNKIIRFDSNVMIIAASLIAATLITCFFKITRFSIIQSPWEFVRGKLLTSAQRFQKWLSLLREVYVPFDELLNNTVRD